MVVALWCHGSTTLGCDLDGPLTAQDGPGRTTPVYMNISPLERNIPPILSFVNLCSMPQTRKVYSLFCSCPPCEF